MVLDISCVPKESTFIPQDLGYDQYSSLLETTSSSYQDWSSYFSVAL